MQPLRQKKHASGAKCLEISGGLRQPRAHMKRSTAALLAFVVALFLGTLRFRVFTVALYEFGDDCSQRPFDLSSQTLRAALRLFLALGILSSWPGPLLRAGMGRMAPLRLPARLSLASQRAGAHAILPQCLYAGHCPADLHRVVACRLPAPLVSGREPGVRGFSFRGRAQRRFFRTWPANPPVLLMLCLLTVGSAVATGLGSELPLLVLAAGFLILILL